MLSSYYKHAKVEAKVKRGLHRQVIGGLWDEIGDLQLNFLIAQGLKPHHTLLDIGCGCLRAGVKLIRYLDAGCYYGTDINPSLLDAGYDIELNAAGLQHKMPREHLIADGTFDFGWSPRGVIDFALAQSVFTHLPLNILRTCLEQLADAMAPAGVFYFTIFEIPETHPTFMPFTHHPGGRITLGAMDPYHYRYSDVEFCCRNLPWTPHYVGDWSHPRAQRMIKLVRDR